MVGFLRNNIYIIIYSLQLYNSVIFVISTGLSSHHHYLTQNMLIPPKRNPVSISSHSKSPPAPWSPPTTHLFSVSLDLPTPIISCNENQTLCDLLCLASFTQHKVLKVQPYRGMDQDFNSFLWLIFPSMDIPDFVYPFIHHTWITTWVSTFQL